MFLNESSYNEAAAEPSFLLEAVLEANEQYHNLSMKMIKCEHTCIINENVAMLREAEEKFLDKAKRIVKDLANKIIHAIVTFFKFIKEKIVALGNLLKKIGRTVKTFFTTAYKEFKKGKEDTKKISKEKDPDKLPNVSTAEVKTEAEETSTKEEVNIQEVISEGNQAKDYLKDLADSLSNWKKSVKEEAEKEDKNAAMIVLSRIGKKISGAIATVKNTIVNLVKTIKDAIIAGKNEATKEFNKKPRKQKNVTNAVANGTASSYMIDWDLFD